MTKVKDNEREYSACHEWEERLETALESGADKELKAHLGQCVACREAFEAARFAGTLLRESLEPAGETPAWFAARVMAGVRAEEAERESQGRVFWHPIEVLASRLAVAAAVVILLLTVYIFEGGAPQFTALAPSQSEMSDSFPALTGQPSSADEVLQSLSEPSNGR